MYNDKTNYYKKGIVNKSFIKKDKVNYYKNWQEINFNIYGNIDFNNTTREDTKVVNFYIEFKVYSTKRRYGVIGKAKNTIKLQKKNGNIIIIDEQQKIIENNSYHD